MTSLYVAIGLNFIAILLLLGACWVAIRGLGGISAVRAELIVLTTAVERTDERITREVKTRAGDAGAAKQAEERSLLEQAQEEIAKPESRLFITGRPKRFVRRN